MRTLRTTILGALLLVGGLIANPVNAQNITLNSGSGDIFFLYNSSADVWNTVFRAKGSAGQPTTTGATGLTDPWTPFTGALGTIEAAQAGDTGDYLFDSLTVNLNLSETLTVDGTDFYFADANGQFTNSTPTADLGIRIRLREDEVAMGTGTNTALDQFDNFTFTVNMTASTFNGDPLENTSAHVSLLEQDTFEQPVALFNTAEDELTGTLNSVWTHQHRNWGFSEYGQYSLVLDVEGVGGEYGNSGTQTTLNFDVIPEPSTLGLLLLGLGFGNMLRKQRLAKSS